MARKKRTRGCDIDMTPMIDVVFQLIIFFIVTINMEQQYNEEIELEMGKHGPDIEESQLTMIIEVDKRGWISIHNAQLSKQKLHDIMKARYNRYGRFPVLIRGDYRARHSDIRAVMDICTRIGIWKIDFAAIKKKKT